MVGSRQFVACVEQDGRTYRSAPSSDRQAVERAAREAGGWVEAVEVVDLRTRRRKPARHQEVAEAPHRPRP